MTETEISDNYVIIDDEKSRQEALEKKKNSNDKYKEKEPIELIPAFDIQCSECKQYFKGYDYYDFYIPHLLREHGIKLGINLNAHTNIGLKKRQKVS